MKISLFLAMTVNGYIAREDGDSDWVNDEESFTSACRRSDVIIVGHNTFRQYQGDLYPIAGVLNVVFTHDPVLLKTSTPDLIFTQKSPKELITDLEKDGRRELLIVGGSHLAASFLKENLITDIYLDVHPLMLGQGIKLCADCDFEAALTLLEVTKLSNGLVQLHYSVNK
ncbi:MAG TPA: dihydrofolate reductase family protein [Patescibacteria group bacterium]